MEAFAQCVKSSGYDFRPWDPHHVNATAKRWHFMSTVQVDWEQPMGFATHCDWIIGIRPLPHIMEHLPPHVAWGQQDRLPQTIFLQVEQQQNFTDFLLPCIPASHRFVLITGDHDKTTPRQTDLRFDVVLRPNTWDAWLADPRILHLFVEHLDTHTAPAHRVTPLPLGLNPSEYPNNNANLARKELAGPVVPITNRPVKMLFANRVRDGAQWQDRVHASTACHALPHCDVARVRKPQYFRTIKRYPFLLCVHGGGLDPNPNIWQALIAGVIPIMAPFPGMSMYKDWPIVVLSDGNWSHQVTTNLTLPYLTRRLHELAPHFENADQRARVVERLTMEYWWNKVQRVLKNASYG